MRSLVAIGGEGSEVCHIILQSWTLISPAGPYGVMNASPRRLTPPRVRSLEIRLMEGRMKGQAFVTFPSQSLAGDGLSLVNGFVMRDKPLVVVGHSALRPVRLSHVPVPVPSSSSPTARRRMHEQESVVSAIFHSFYVISCFP